jgi:hypothetical protein
MISRLSWVSVATAALLTVASACLAADSVTGAGPGRASVGGSLGLSSFGHGDPTQSDYKADWRNWSGQYSVGAQSRFSFAGAFRYQVSNRLRWQVSPGFEWMGFAKKGIPAPFTDVNFPTEKNKDDYLVLLAPISVQVQALVHGKTWLQHVGVGGGAYRLWVENHRKVLKDPVTLRTHRGVYPGVSFEYGAEHFFKGLPNTSIELMADANWVFAQREKQFVSGLNSNVFAGGLRVGTNYYFDPKRFTKAPAQPPGPAK